MARLKTRQQLDLERLELARYALGREIQLDCTRILYIYCRQSTDRQYFKSDKNNTQQRSELETIAYEALQWPRELVRIRVENDTKHKQGATSGTKSIQDRPLLNEIYQDVKRGLVGGVLVVDVSRLSRDEDLIDPTVFAKACKRNDTAIITSADSYIYDFNHPTRDDLKRFTDEAYVAAQFIKRQIKGKMLKARTTKANNGLLGSGQAPIGMMVNEDGDGLVPSPHAERVDWVYGRYRAHGANLTALFREVVSMTRQGIPLFPYDESIHPKSIHLDTLVDGDVTSGWTIKSRYGLRYLLSNPTYNGHLVFNNRVVKMNAHAPIVDADNWHYAFTHLSDVDLEGNEIEREARTVRYTQRTSVDNGALLAGTRDNGKLVIDGVNGAHVYYNRTMKAYLLLQRNVPTVYGFETSITTKELDAILEARLLHWLNASERQEQYNSEHQYTSPGHSPYQAMDKVEKSAQPTSTIQDYLEETNQEIARVQRALQFQDSMSDARLEETLKKEARLIKRRAELEHAQADEERLARQREQAQDDVETAASKWGKWSIDERRSFIRLVTESITLEELASGWLRLTLVWSPIMGFVYPMTSVMRAVEIGYLWRQSGTRWSEDEEETMRSYYPTSPRSELLRMLPTRPWVAVVAKSTKMGLRRLNTKHDRIDQTVSLTDVQVLSEFMLKRERVQWQHVYSHPQISNDDFIS